MNHRHVAATSPRRHGAPSAAIAIGLLACLAAGRAASAQVVFATDFENGLPAAFTAPGAALEGVQNFSGLGGAGRQFGGNFLRYASTDVLPTTLSLSGLPPHTSVDIAFLLAIIDSWDHEGLQVRVDGQVVFAPWFDQYWQVRSYEPAPGEGLLSSGFDLGFNYGNWYYADLAFDLGVEPLFRNIPHTSSTLTIEWTILATAGPWASNWQGGLDESWGIDAVRISVSNASATPFGVGCGQPALTATPAPHSLPRLASEMRTNVANVPAGIAFMALGLSNTTAGGLPLPLSLAPFGMPGCDLRIDAIDLVQPCAPVDAGTVQHRIVVPANPVLPGLQVYLQAWAPAPGFNAAGIVVSNGVALTVGA